MAVIVATVAVTASVMAKSKMSPLMKANFEALTNDETDVSSICGGEPVYRDTFTQIYEGEVWEHDFNSGKDNVYEVKEIKCYAMGEGKKRGSNRTSPPDKKFIRVETHNSNECGHL